MCKQGFTKDNYKVRDHCHVTRKFRGAACNACNLKLKLSHRIPVIFHNLRGYDSHLLMQKIGEFKRKLNVIPNNMEKYLAFSVGTEKLCYDNKSKKLEMKTRFDLNFIDSFQFMSTSLENLVKNLKASGLDKFKYIQQAFDNNSELLTQKGIYPYSFMDKWEKFDVLVGDLKKEHFVNDLTDDGITDEDFNFYIKVCKSMNIRTLGEYHDLYLKTDVLLLADVFENFRKTCMEYYQLDPCHYFSSPGIAWDACLKMTDISLELISDIDMYNFIEKGLRGGVSIITHRKATANNKYLDTYNSSKPSVYIPCLDANNLYGFAMSQYLPYGSFKWIESENFSLQNVNEYSELGHIVEVDLEYPKELHDLHNDYPYCPEHFEIKSEMVSDYSRKIAITNGLNYTKSNKLLATLCKKERYVIHERNLKQAVDAGLVVTKIHRVLQFKQKPWMKKYIDFNTDKGNYLQMNLRKIFSS